MKKTFFFLFALLPMMAFAQFDGNTQPNHCIPFNGTDQYMLIPHHEDFNIAADESFTLTGWVRNEVYDVNENPASYPDFPHYVCKRDFKQSRPGDERSGYEYFGLAEEGKSLGLNTPTSTTGHAFTIYTGVTAPVGEWMHFALVVDRLNNEIRIYQNGETKDDWAGTLGNWTVTNTHDVFIGTGNYGGEPIGYCQGSIGNVRFYSKGLSAEEISVDLNNSDLQDLSSVMRNSLLAAYDFSTTNINGNIMVDLSGHGHDGQMMNFNFGGAVINDVTLTQDTRKTGRGKENDVLLKAAVTLSGNNAVVDLHSMVLELGGTTDLNDIEEIKVYSTGSINTFDERYPQRAILLGSVVPASGNLTCNLQGYLVSGTNYLWVVAHVADDAKEGHVIDASLKSIVTSEQTYNLTNPSPDGCREIILARTLLFQPGDYNSKNYRIPAVITAKDGSIVATTDKRKFNQADLPEDIDIVCNRSTDGGHTWSEPYTIALGTGYNEGFGDCALAWSNDDNGLIAGFCGGVGTIASSSSNPLRAYISKSYDNGQTWSERVDITDFLVGDNCVVDEHRTWRSAFFASGNGLLLSTGRIMFVAAVIEDEEYVFNDYAVYSDDNGETWQVSGRVSVGADEAKVTELADGRILMSMRHSSNGEYNRWYSISEDGGETWQPTPSVWDDFVTQPCNGDMIRYTSVSQGHDKNRLLHSMIYGDPPTLTLNTRTDVTVYVSYNEGESWPVSKCIIPYRSGYSSLCVLPDGTIGLYVEEIYSGNSGYSMVFYNFSLDWLTDGNDSFDPSEVAEVQTFTKEISGYDADAETPDHYYLIASPIGVVNTDDVENMLENDFDLYRFDQTNGHLEWVNYEGDNGGYNLRPGKGYLYANSEDVTLTFTGYPYQCDGKVRLSKAENVRFSGWNLVGNPFAETAYIGDKAFYRMNEKGTEVEAATDAAIKPMEGVFVVANDDDEVLIFSTKAPANPDKKLVLNIVRNRGNVIDRGVVRFDNGDVLPKFQINPNSTKVYFPQDDKDYAVVNAGKNGEMPVNFKAAANGTYTINVSAQEVDFRYLHLIDNLMDADIDLLVTPSYTFEANVTDMDYRFKLVFVCRDANDINDFAFFSTGNWIINNEGSAILQVIDVQGRVLSSEQISGCVSKRLDATPGVYIMRLVNGENVRVQKVVVR